MPCEERLAQCVEALARAFDQQQLLRVRFDPTLPAIDRLDARDDVDARGEALLDEVARQRGDVERCADGGQDDDRRQRCSAWSICFAASCASRRSALRFCAHSKIGSVTAVKIDRPPTAKETGVTTVVRWCGSTVSISFTSCAS